LLFVFILLALSFAHQLELALREAKAREAEAAETVSQAERARALAQDLISMGPAPHPFSVAACLERAAAGALRVRAVPTEAEARLSLYLDADAASIEWFESGSASLGPGPCAVARGIGPCLEQAFGHPALGASAEFRLRVFVEGHTDALPVRGGGFPTNWELSGARAAAVVRGFLVPDPRRADCSAEPGPAGALEARSAAGRLEVVSVGLADRRPAWKRLCDGAAAGAVCGCLLAEGGDASACAGPLIAAGVPAELQPADRLVAWANAPGLDDPDGRRRLLRRVDLRFEVVPTEALEPVDPSDG
jgi:flagellar motor protein MotB